MKEKCSFVDEIISQGTYFFYPPESYDADVIKKRWNDKSKTFIAELKNAFSGISDFTAPAAENCFKQTAEKLGIKTGDVMQLFRVCISGVGGGPALFEVAALLGKDETIKRLAHALNTIK